MIDKIIKRYLIVREEKENCAHCHKSQPMKGKTVCQKCSSELDAFRNKASKDTDKDGGEKG